VPHKKQYNFNRLQTVAQDIAGAVVLTAAGLSSKGKLKSRILTISTSWNANACLKEITSHDCGTRGVIE
jgi:hypothetical protein